jgi:hypothetical protein
MMPHCPRPPLCLSFSDLPFFYSFRYYLLFLNTSPLRLWNIFAHRRVSPNLCARPGSQAYRGTRRMLSQTSYLLPLGAGTPSATRNFTHALTSAYTALIFPGSQAQTIEIRLTSKTRCMIPSFLHRSRMGKVQKSTCLHKEPVLMQRPRVSVDREAVANNWNPLLRDSQLPVVPCSIRMTAKTPSPDA